MESIQNNEDLLHKWDIILVEIFKKEWPQNWTSFVHDLVTSALESESRCREQHLHSEDCGWRTWLFFSATDK